MSLKRTIRVLIVGLLACIFGVFIVSCKEQSRTIVGFSVEEEISVQYQDTYYIARPTVKDGQDNPLDVEVTVVDSFQSVVPLVADGFVVEDMAGYKIIYTVYFNSECYTKTTVVNVNRKGEIELSFSQTDKFMTVEKETSVAEVEYEHFVPVTIEYYYQNAEEEVKIENGVFTPKMTGYYSVIAKAQDEYGNRGSAYYRLYCQRASEKGEVEIYDAEREFLVKEGLMEEPRGYVYVDTDETGIYDHLGRKANFAKIETTDEFINFSLLPKMTKKYYNTLAEEGFEYISLWVYIDGGENAYNFYRKMGISGYLQTGIGTYGANDWIELRLNLQDENNDYLRSFLSAYDEICSRTVMPFFMHNQQREKLTVYIEDVYAVKPVSEEEFILSEIEEKTLGEYISLTEYVDSDYEWYCQATVNGSSFIMDNEDFLLTENGEYTLSFLAKEKAYYIDKTVKFKVNNPYTFYALSLIKNQTNGFEKIPFAELQASFSNGETTVDSSEISYSVSYLGKNFDCDELGFMPDRIGGYTITATATVAVGENEYVLKENCVVDVYTEQSKFDLFTVDSRATEFSYVYKNHAWDVLPKSYVYTGSVGETADTYYVMDTNSLLGSGLQTMYVNFGFIPTYSLNYYTELLNDNPDMVLDFNLYFEDLSGKTDANSQPFPKAYWDYKAGYVFGVKVDTWQEYKTLFTLKDLVNGYYEVFAEDGLNRLEGGKGKSLLVVNTDARRTKIYFSTIRFVEIEETGELFGVSSIASKYNKVANYTWVFPGTSVVSNPTVDGTTETGTFLKIYQANTEYYTFYVKPTKSLEYYRQHKDDYVYIRYYIQSEESDFVPVRYIGSSDSTAYGYGVASATNIWQELIISVADVVNYYDRMVAGYNEPKAENIPYALFSAFVWNADATLYVQEAKILTGELSYTYDDSIPVEQYGSLDLIRSCLDVEITLSNGAKIPVEDYVLSGNLSVFGTNQITIEKDGFSETFTVNTVQAGSIDPSYITWNENIADFTKAYAYSNEKNLVKSWVNSTNDTYLTADMGNCLLLSGFTNNDPYNVKFATDKSVAYFQSLKSLGYTAITFRFSFNVTDSANTNDYNQFASFGKGDLVDTVIGGCVALNSSSNGRWYSFSLTIDEIIENYTALTVLDSNSKTYVGENSTMNLRKDSWLSFYMKDLESVRLYIAQPLLIKEDTDMQYTTMATALSSVSVYRYGEEKTDKFMYSVVSGEEVGKTGNFFKIMGSNNGTDFGFSLRIPIALSLDNLQTLKEDGYTALSFDWYSEKTPTFIYTNEANSEYINQTTGVTAGWQTRTISIDYLIEHYEAFCQPNSYASSLLRLYYSSWTEGVTVYLSELKFVK